MKLYVKFAGGSFEQKVNSREHAAEIMAEISKRGPILEFKLL